jgi:hypothetical protein
MKRVLDIIAIAGAVGGSTIIALNLGWNVFGYFLFLMSSLASLKLLVSSKSPPSLIITNLWFTVINVVGLVRY